jgi:cyclopropane-fatty-acyl-phospholipid synthase
VTTFDQTDTVQRTAARGGLYRRAVLAALKPMEHGVMRLTMPEGSVLTIGRGTNPRDAAHGVHAEMRILDANFFRRCFYYGDIGLAESYMAGEWETGDLAEVISWFILNHERSQAQSGSAARQKILGWFGWLNQLGHRLRANDLGRSQKNIAAHYDLSNEFFATFLDPSMTYSSALYRTGDESLADAQHAKYDRICRMLRLEPGMRVLEIGGGWGALSRMMAESFGCHVTTLTLSERQFEWASEARDRAGLGDRIDIRLLDYRRVTGTFDRIVSIEMLEAVGHEYFDAFFAKCEEVLAPNGLVALQAITAPETRYESMRKGVDFIQKHIFPGGHIPSVGALLESVHRSTRFTLHDLHDFGLSYATTLQQWADAFESQRDRIRALGFNDEAFLRKWRYYFMYCKAGFQMRHISVVQMLLTRPNCYTLKPMEAGS